MPTANPERAAAWKALNPEQRDAALSRMTPEQKSSLAADLGFQTSASETKITPPSLYERFSKPESKEAIAAHPVQGRLADVGRGVVSGVGTMIEHPVDSLSAGTQTIGDLLGVVLPNSQTPEKLEASKKRLKEQYEAAKAHPEFTVGQILGGGALTHGVSKAGGAILDKVPGVTSNIVEGVTGTSPKVTKNLVKETQATNLEEGEKTARANATDAERGRLKTLTREKSQELQARIETARNNALKIGNEKYSAVNEKLSPIPADMEHIHNAYQAATDAIGEAQAEPTILTRLGKVLNHGEQLKYSDLQALYSELGKELSKGTLPGRTFHAYDILHDAVGEDMQRVADSQGQGAQLTEARAYWKRMKQTFGKSGSARDAASKTLQSLSPEFTKNEDLSNKVRLLSHYDPEIAPAAKAVTEARTGSKALPKLTSGEPPKKLNVEDIQQAKKASLESKAQKLSTSHSPIMSSIAAYDAIRSVIQGEYGRAALDVGARAIYGVGKEGLSRLLSQPAVVDFLTKATERDLAQVPVDLRGNLPVIVKQAQKSGVKVSPALLAFGAAASPKGVAKALAPPQQ